MVVNEVVSGVIAVIVGYLLGSIPFIAAARAALVKAGSRDNLLAELWRSRKVGQEEG